MTDMDIEFGDYLRFVFALLFVLALIGVLVAVARRFGLGFAVPTRNGKQRRLSIVEVIPVDGKRRTREKSRLIVAMGFFHTFVAFLRLEAQRRDGAGF